MVTTTGFVLAFLAALSAGIINALAGGGTLITFPVLTAIGLPAVSANVTSTVALSPGYLGGTLGQKNDLQGQKRRLWLLLPVSVVGGLLGGLLLLYTGERIFREVVPYLILMASGLLAIQDPVKRWVSSRSQPGASRHASELWATLPVLLATIYGGYFGAGVSVIVLAVLGLVIDDSLTRLNALKQAISFATNIAAAVFFVFSGQVVWSVAAIMAVGAILGGVIGGRLAGKVKPATLRWLVVTIGVVVAVIYLMW